MKNHLKFGVKLLALLFSLEAFAGVGEITKIDFVPTKDSARLVLHFTGAGKFRVFQSEQQSNVILEAENLVLPARLTKLIDSSTSGGPVLQLTPYNSANAGRSISKFVLQLKGQAEVVSSEIPGKFVVELKRRSFVKTPLKKLPTLSRKGWSETDKVKTQDSAIDKSEEVATKLVEVLNAAPEEKVYTGTRVTFEGTNVDVHDIFRLVGDASGLNLVTDSDVAYKSNYSLQNIPWDQLLDLVMQQAQLKAAITGNVVRISTMAKYAAEQQAKLKEIDLADELEPVVMAVIPLSFATAEEMKRMIETLLVRRDIPAPGAAAVAPAAAAAAAAATPTATAVPGPTPAAGTAAAPNTKLIQDFVRGRIEVDSRSNSLVITNTRETIERVKKLVKELDVALPQVLIDAKIIIATENFSKNVGVSWGGRATSSGSGRAGGAGGFNSSPISLGDNASSATAVASTTAATAATTSTSSSEFSVSPGTGESAGMAFGFQVGAGRHGNLSATLNLAEVNGVSKTVASPRVIVNNKKTATVVDGQTLLLNSAAGANAAGELNQIAASLNLTVTPQVTSAGSVLLNINVKKDQPIGTEAVENKQLQTEVLVDSGSTLVLGGVYQSTQSKKERGIPVLKDLPFIGQLFRTNEEGDVKNELMVFITPEILDPNSPGLGSMEGTQL